MFHLNAIYRQLKARKSILWDNIQSAPYQQEKNFSGVSGSDAFKAKRAVSRTSLRRNLYILNVYTEN